jgi:hypothetical protein
LLGHSKLTLFAFEEGELVGRALFELFILSKPLESDPRKPLPRLYEDDLLRNYRSFAPK